MKYVALLRGINMGKNKKIPMADLKKVLESNGYKSVKTILASGNVVFESENTNISQLKDETSGLLEQTFGFPISITIRNFSEITHLIESDPFQEIEATKDKSLYITFISKQPENAREFPITPIDGFQILSKINHSIASIVDLSKTGTLDAMSFLEKEYGKDITTRNWNTVKKISSL